MKKIIIATVVTLTTFFSATAQNKGLDRLRNMSEPSSKEVALTTIPTVNGNYEYMSVVTVDSTLKKSDLYRNSKLYFADNFRSANDVIQYDDKDEGMVVGKGHFIITESNSSLITPIILTWDVWYNTSIESKDGRYRYRLYDISIIQNSEGSGRSTLTIDDAKTATTKGVVKKISASLFNKMADRFSDTEMSIRAYMAKSQGDRSRDF